MSDIVTTQAIYRPVFVVEALGEMARLPDGGIINAGGVAGPNFTVAGKPLLFADGTSTDGSPAANIHIDMQGAYTNSVSEAFVQFTSGKDLVFNALNNKQFRFDAETGLVTITGDLTVIGNMTAVINTVADVERISIRPVDGTIVPFIFEPVSGVIPTVDLFDVKAIYGGSSVFTIGPTGTTYIQTLNTGLINGIDITALAQDLSDHENPAIQTIKHTGENISVDTQGLTNVSGTNVQEAIESIDSRLNSVAVNGVHGVEHVQTVASTNWVINHNSSSERVQVTIWDSNNEMVFADSVRIIDANTLNITFSSHITGRAILMIF